MRGFTVGLLLAAAACSPRPEVATGAERLDRSSSAPGSAVTLERTACFGSCPVYRISVSPAGLVSYDGRADVRQTGTATAQIPSQRVDSLLQELERAGYFTFADRYVPSEPTCGRHSTDSPSAISSATYRGRTKSIEHYYGCVGVPGALTMLEKRIDEVLGSERWTGG